MASQYLNIPVPTPTQNPVPSADIRDHVFGGAKIDEFVTSLVNRYIDRFGNEHLTISGIENLFMDLMNRFEVDVISAILSTGIITLDSFQKGVMLPNNEITLINQVLRDERNGLYYRWNGQLPKQVFAGSTPESTGGISENAWLLFGNDELTTSAMLLDLPFGEVSYFSPGMKSSSVLYNKSTNETLIAFSEIELPYNIISYNRNDTLGYDVLTDKGVVEFITRDVYSLRHGAYGNDSPDIYIEGWLDKGLGDATKAFQQAINYARKFNTMIRSRAGNFVISERLFFGPRTESDLNTPLGFPVNVCLGFAGDTIESTIISPAPALNGDVVFDMTGLRNKYLSNFKIETTQERCPAIGVLTARFDRPTVGSLSNNDWGEFSNIDLGKWFSVTAYLAASTEEIKVLNCKFRTDHNDAIASYVSTSDLKAIVPGILEARETSLKFTSGIKSNLHQTHIGCDYYLGSVNPTFSKRGMIYIYGSQMVSIQNPFFNNNATNHDAVVVDKPASEAFVYGIHVSSANYHQTVKSGMRLLAANTSCSLTNSNRTHSFVEGALVIEAYTNGFFSNYLDGDLIINGELVNSNILSASNMKWDESKGIINSNIGIRLNVTTSNKENRVATNSFNMMLEGYGSYHVMGYYAAPKLASGVLSHVGRAGANAIHGITDFTSFNGSLLKSEHSAVSPDIGFNHFSATENNSEVLRIRKGGIISLDGNLSALHMKDSSGRTRKLVFNSDGSVTCTLV
ncbi:hypothetical protein QT13_02035 [Pectobacterium brasiliense]|uniref:tail fiber/spike domain-containing protein n=1 Tax=Pectobacterium brasiliense TaxID=180957 RepID=UPI0005808654|nr:hypothetical protein [Pectobacterium brasiliense]KHS77042.1 hypothetical protein QT13_02035 [Pectobacterium brasiliense]